MAGLAVSRNMRFTMHAPYAFKYSAIYSLCGQHGGNLFAPLCAQQIVVALALLLIDRC
jgi:hypothetical protein